MVSQQSTLVDLLDEIEQRTIQHGELPTLRSVRDRLNALLDDYTLSRAETSAATRSPQDGDGGAVPPIWDRLWADPALQAFGRWLSARQYGLIYAEQAVARVWSFYSYFVIPAYAGYPPMALSVKDFGDRRDLALHLPKPASTDLSHDQFGAALSKDLDRYERRPVASDLRMRLDLRDVEERDLEHDVIALCEAEQRRFFGVYRDDLAAELTKVIRSDSFHEWLETPREQYGNRKPSDLMHKPDRDLPLREVVLNVKYGVGA